MSISEIPEEKLSVQTLLTCKIERACIIVSNLTHDTTVGETFIFSDNSLDIYFRLWGSGKSSRLAMKYLQCFCDAIARIHWIRDSKANYRI